MTKLITYTLFNPTQNITLLAETPVPEESQPQIAQRLMSIEPETEQVGFVSLTADGIRLRMAGGEFCGNASMSAAALYMERSGRKESNVTVHVSGTLKPVWVSMRELSAGLWRGIVNMPEPLSIKREVFPGGRILPVVRFPGISHVILEDTFDRKSAEAMAAKWCRYLDSEAVGLMFLDREQLTLDPLVFVPAAKTLCWESSCASGTTAAGAFLAAEYGQTTELPLRQPGGTLTITAHPNGQLFLEGKVSMVRKVTEAVL